MAKNGEAGKGRIGAVKNRVQYYNPKTDQWVKVNKDTGQFMDVKKDGTPFKGVTKNWFKRIGLLNKPILLNCIKTTANNKILSLFILNTVNEVLFFFKPPNTDTRVCTNIIK